MPRFLHFDGFRADSQPAHRPRTVALILSGLWRDRVIRRVGILVAVLAFALMASACGSATGTTGAPNTTISIQQVTAVAAAMPDHPTIVEAVAKCPSGQALLSGGFSGASASSATTQTVAPSISSFPGQDGASWVVRGTANASTGLTAIAECATLPTGSQSQTPTSQRQAPQATTLSTHQRSTQMRPSSPCLIIPTPSGSLVSCPYTVDSGQQAELATVPCPSGALTGGGPDFTPGEFLVSATYPSGGGWKVAVSAAAFISRANQEMEHHDTLNITRSITVYALCNTHLTAAAPVSASVPIKADTAPTCTPGSLFDECIGTASGNGGASCPKGQMPTSSGYSDFQYSAGFETPLAAGGIQITEYGLPHILVSPVIGSAPPTIFKAGGSYGTASAHAPSVTIGETVATWTTWAPCVLIPQPPIHICSTCIPQGDVKPEWS